MLFAVLGGRSEPQWLAGIDRGFTKWNSLAKQGPSEEGTVTGRNKRFHYSAYVLLQVLAACWVSDVDIVYQLCLFWSWLLALGFTCPWSKRCPFQEPIDQPGHIHVHYMYTRVSCLSLRGNLCVDKHLYRLSQYFLFSSFILLCVLNNV